MRTSHLVATCLFASAFMVNVTRAVPPILFSDDFDVDSSANWTANAGVGFDPNFNSVPMDSHADFFFDYSAAGIPPAPNSVGNTTIGMKLQANLTANALGGFSVSPTGQDFTGDYSITFDAWSSTLGPFPFGDSGSTNLSTFGLLTGGTTSQAFFSTDGVYFAYTGDGGSAADYRVYSVEKVNSYQIDNPDVIDLHATYFAGTRNGTGQLYLDATGDPNGDGITVPQSVINAVPGADLSGTLFLGAAGFAWHQHEIRKVGSIAQWYVNGFLLIELELSSIDDPDDSFTVGGGNISFGHLDVNFTSSTSPFAQDLLFTLIDNVVVTSLIPEPTTWLLLCLGAVAASGIRPSRLALARK